MIFSTFFHISYAFETRGTRYGAPRSHYSRFDPSTVFDLHCICYKISVFDLPCTHCQDLLCLPQAQFEDFSEAFHKSLFDLQILTRALLDGQYILAARVLVMTAQASSPYKTSMRYAGMLKKDLVLKQLSGYSMNMDLTFELRILN